MQKITCLALVCLATTPASSAIANTFLSNNTPGFLSLSGFTQKNGGHIASANCGPNKTCSFEWPNTATYLRIELRFSNNTTIKTFESKFGFSGASIACTQGYRVIPKNPGWIYDMDTVVPDGYTCDAYIPNTHK